MLVPGAHIYAPGNTYSKKFVSIYIETDMLICLGQYRYLGEQICNKLIIACSPTTTVATERTGYVLYRALVIGRIGDKHANNIILHSIEKVVI